MSALSKRESDDCNHAISINITVESVLGVMVTMREAITKTKNKYMAECMMGCGNDTRG